MSMVPTAAASQIAISQAWSIRWLLLVHQGFRTTAGHRIGLDELGNCPIQVDGARLGDRLLVPVAESDPQLRVQLVVLLRADGPHPVTDQSGAALGECVELAGTLDPAVPELCRRPELQCI